MEEEEAVRKRAIATRQTILLADLLYSHLFREACTARTTIPNTQRKSLLQRRSSPHREGQLGTIPDDECFGSTDHCSKCHHAEGQQDHVGRCSEGLKLTQLSCGNLGATSARWERKLEQELLDMGAIKVPEFPSTCTFPSYGNFALVVYVDDFLLSGDSDSGSHDAFWAELPKWIMIEDVGDLGRFLGRHHTTIAHDDHERLAFDMRAYAKDMIQDYVSITNTKVFKRAHTPFLAKVAEHLDDDNAVGELATSASSVLMKLMWVSRLARPDPLRATTWLATKVQKWSRSCDTHLPREHARWMDRRPTRRVVRRDVCSC